MFELSVTRRFFATHRVREPDGNLEPPHEHDWRVTVTVAGERLDEGGLLVDFGLIQRALDEVLAPLAGRDLNEVPAFAARLPSAEHVALHIAEQVGGILPAAVRLTRVEVEEQPGCTVGWVGDSP